MTSTENICMSSFKLIHVDSQYRDRKTVLMKLWTKHGLQLANLIHIDSIPKDLQKRMLTLDEQSRIILLNRRITRDEYTTLMPKQMFPFCSVYKNGAGISVLETSEALRQGNYFLCHPKEKASTVTEKEPLRSPSPSPSGGGHYRYHVSIESTRIWRSKPAYVNMDRPSDNIGKSSWDGNLVSWFQAGFQSRMLYAKHSGLLPDE